MIINTTHFGKIEILEEDVIEFVEGMPGFEDNYKFVIVDSDDPNSHFKWIQSIENLELAFVLVDPFAIKKDYDFELKDEYVKTLGIEDINHVAVFAVVVVPKDTSKISMNLKAPIIVNMDNRKAAQIILDTDMYTVRHYILDELRKQEV